MGMNRAGDDLSGVFSDTVHAQYGNNAFSVELARQWWPVRIGRCPTQKVKIRTWEEAAKRR